MELFEQIRREYEQGAGTIRGIARRLGVHRRMVRQALAGAVSVEPLHLFRYVDERLSGYNNRKELDDAGRLSLVVSRIIGKRLTYDQLTGKVGEKPAPLAC